MMEFAFQSQQLFQPLGHVGFILAFDSGCPVIAPGVNNDMLVVRRRSVRKRFVIVDAQSTRQNRWTSVDSPPLSTV